MEDAGQQIPAFPAGKCEVGRVAEDQVEPRQAQDSDVLQTLSADKQKTLINSTVLHQREAKCSFTFNNGGGMFTPLLVVFFCLCAKEAVWLGGVKVAHLI